MTLLISSKEYSWILFPGSTPVRKIRFVKDGSFLHFELKSAIDTSELQSSLIQFTEALFGLALWYVEVTA
jgi:hypothetical protein